VRIIGDALLKVEDWASNRLELTEDLIQRIHGLVEKGNERNQNPTAMARISSAIQCLVKLFTCRLKSKDVPGADG